jgi:hypothetical protein
VVAEDAGPWRGIDLETWLARIAAPVLREGETLPLIKPFPVPVQEESTGATRTLAVLAQMYLDSGECQPEDRDWIAAIVAAHDEPAA